MEVSHVVLYGAAAIFALRSLISLMASHKQRVQDELHARDLRERKAAARRRKSARQPDSGGVAA